jgi:23S rRNA (guanosine2251-2'-O)-methyltransferase
MLYGRQIRKKDTLYFLFFLPIKNGLLLPNKRSFSNRLRSKSLLLAHPIRLKIEYSPVALYKKVHTMPPIRKLLTEEMDRLTVEEFHTSDKFPFVIVLDNIRSLNNVGSFFRTADAFRAEKLFLCGYTPHPPHREITKSALGAELSVSWEKTDTTLEAVNRLKAQGYLIVSVEQAEGSTLLNHFKAEPEGKYAFVFGNEVEGVADEIIAISDACLEIPQFGTKHSFNVSVSAGILLWEFVRQKI